MLDLTKMPEAFRKKWLEYDRTSWCQLTYLRFEDFMKQCPPDRTILHCALPLEDALDLTNQEMPPGMQPEVFLDKYIYCRPPQELLNWEYNPKLKCHPQPQYFHALPQNAFKNNPWFAYDHIHKHLYRNARYLRYNHELWQQLRPKTLQGVFTTLILVEPQFDLYLTKHLTLHQLYYKLGGISRVEGPCQLFPAEYLFPDAQLGNLSRMPAPIWGDVLPMAGGINYPCQESWVDEYGNHVYFDEHLYTYSCDAQAIYEDKTVQEFSPLKGVMSHPDGSVYRTPNATCTYYASLDPSLNADLKLRDKEFYQRYCLLRSVITHDGLPFALPAEMMCALFAVVVTHWVWELEKPGDLKSPKHLTLSSSIIRGRHLHQQTEPYYSNFMRLIHNILKNPACQPYPVTNRYNHYWLGGNLCLSQRFSKREHFHGTRFYQSYYQQQMDWLLGMFNLMNHINFRLKSRNPVILKSDDDLEASLPVGGMLWNQMALCYPTNGYMFDKPELPPSTWPNQSKEWEIMDSCSYSSNKKINPFRLYST